MRDTRYAKFDYELIDYLYIKLNEITVLYNIDDPFIGDKTCVAPLSFGLLSAGLMTRTG